MRDFKVIMGNCISEQKEHAGLVIIARVNQNIVGWEDNLHLLKASPKMLKALEHVASLPGFEPNEPYGIEALKAIEEAKTGGIKRIKRGA